MAIAFFPPVESADENGLLALGGDVEISSLLLAYSQGIFPWPIPGVPHLAWFSPDPRGVIFVEDLVISTSMKKLMAKNKYRVSFNQAFHQVIHHCATSQNRKEATWITPQIIDGYLNLFRVNHAYSVEVWENDDLVGGLYGVVLGKYISGESMFYIKSNASKFALISLINFLKTKNIKWLDTQMVTPTVASLGGKDISRKDFLTHLQASLRSGFKQTIFKY